MNGPSRRHPATSTPICPAYSPDFSEGNAPDHVPRNPRITHQINIHSTELSTVIEAVFKDRQDIGDTSGDLITEGKKTASLTDR